MNLSNAKTANTENPKLPEQAKPMGYLQKMYADQAKAQKEVLKQQYDQNVNQLNQQRKENALRTDANLNRTNVEANKAARNYGEIQNAYGLSSGAMAQAKLAQQNQLQKDLTLLRLQQNQADAKADANLSLLQQAYLGNQAKIDAEAAAAAAKDQYKQDLAAGQLMAGKGDYNRLGDIYGLTPEEIKKLTEGASSGGGSDTWHGPLIPAKKKGGLDFGTDKGGSKTGFDTGLSAHPFYPYVPAPARPSTPKKPTGAIGRASGIATNYYKK